VVIEKPCRLRWNALKCKLVAFNIQGVIFLNVEKILCVAKLRATHQRKLVLRLLVEKGSPLSHSEISSTLVESLDKVTLYRTLQTLKAAGIVHQVQGLDGVWRFCAHDPESKGCPGDHPHFLCLHCGKMFCLTDQRLPRVEVPEGMTVEGKQLVVYGCCSECSPETEAG
jgi:Fur family ferric uptake transcriptional regulator/Fur family zinc uptake transcriptional regulator